jgi:hypothetical protein
VIEEDFAIVSTLGELIRENQLATKGDVTTKFVPLRGSDLVRQLECLEGLYGSEMQAD